MPVVAHPKLPSIDRLADQGMVLTPEQALENAYDNELHIGLLNLMPDAALEATERQFIRLLASDNQTLVHVYPTTVDAESRSDYSKKYIEQHYNAIKDFMSRDYDGLIISGANPSQADMTQESFWEPLIEVMEWAEQNTNSILCSCLATHALMKAKFNINRTLRKAKSWGVFPHRILHPDHPLMENITDGFNGPHSHYYDISIEEIEETNLKILAVNDRAGFFLLATQESDLILFQGHPEYDDKSLLKEYEREIKNYLSGQRSDYPEVPENYFSNLTVSRLDEEKKNILNNKEFNSFDSFALEDIDLGWIETGNTLYKNWLSLISKRK